MCPSCFHGNHSPGAAPFLAGRARARSGRMFPTTRGSVLGALKAPDEASRARAREAVASAYWRPAVAYLRLHWRMTAEDAQDAVQAFFARALEKDVLERFEPGRAAFRTFLRSCLDHHVANDRRDAARQKRGGDAEIVSLDATRDDGSPLLEPAGGLSPEEIFHREWVRGLWSLGVERLRERLESSGRGAHWILFSRMDLEPAEGAERPSYAAAAAELGLSVTQVTNQLAAARRELRALLAELLRELTASDDEYRAEARALFGEDAP